MISAVMATYPARRNSVGMAAETLLNQVDRLIIVANQYGPGQLEHHLPAGCEVFVPEMDLKDTAKFYIRFEESSYVACCDDDILYPSDYISRMRYCYDDLARLSPIIGVHGVNYPEPFDGDPHTRTTYPFWEGLDHRCFVGQLGSGTIFCKARQLAPYRFMQDASRYVDLRFAGYCQSKGFPRVCIDRTAGWLAQIETSESLYQAFTVSWPDEVVRQTSALRGWDRLASAACLASGRRENLLRRLGGYLRLKT